MHAPRARLLSRLETSTRESSAGREVLLGVFAEREASAVMPDAGPEEWYRGLPKITRAYLTISFVQTVLVQTELVSPYLLYLDFGRVGHDLEFWRLLTNLCFFGKFSMGFVFSMFFLVRYGRELEAKRFEGRTADYLWCLSFAALLMTGAAWVLGDQPFLAQSMLGTMVYLWSREFAEQILSIFGLFNVQAFYFPWVLCAIRVLMGGSPVPDLIGIFAGHVYYFLTDIQGYPLKAPVALSDLLDAPVSGQAAARQNRNVFGGHNWGGGGQRLGGN